VAITYNNFGAVHRKKGEYDKALEYYQKAQAINLKTKGADHPHVAITYYNMAFISKALKDLPKAKEYWEKTYAIRLKRLGPNHPDTKDTKAKLDALKE
jgi:tetratricopeptide (TPR) repeat protein